MRLTKLDMARVIVTALYGKSTLVPGDNPEAVRRATKGTVEMLTRQHGLAMAAIQSRRPQDQG